MRVACDHRPRAGPGIAGITLDKPVTRIVVVGLVHLSVLGEVVHPDHRVSAPEQLLDHVPPDEARGAADQNLLHH